MTTFIHWTAELERHRSSLTRTGQERLAHLEFSTRKADKGKTPRQGELKAQTASAAACCCAAQTATA